MNPIPTSFSPVKPISPAAPYIGGKRNLAKRLDRIISHTPHKLYAEPFVGMGGVFFKRSHRPKAEVINDGSKDIANLFRILQRHYPNFMGMMRYQLAARSEFERLKNTNPNTLTDFERAARFIYLQKCAFGGKVMSRSFGVSKDRPARFDITRLAEILDDIHDRLCGVTIECLPYEDFILRYDSSETLFYLDPPYYDCENYYGKDVFAKTDFDALADILSGIKGKFLLSLNDKPEVREIFKAFKISQITTTYTNARTNGGKVSEVLISNYNWSC